MSSAYSLQFEQTLRKVGFTRHEIPLLVHLFRAKRATIKQLSRETALPFSMVQLGLTNLTRRELVVCHPGDEDQYEVCSFAKFKQWLTEEKQKNAQIYDTVEHELDHFQEQVEDNSWRPTVAYYEGAEGIKEIYDDMLATREEIYTCSDLKQLTQLLGHEYTEHFITERIKNGIQMYAIRSEEVDEAVKAEQAQRIKNGKTPADEMRETRTLPKLDLEGEIKIYGDKCAFVTFSGETPVGFVFEGKAISKLMRDFFKLQWKSLE